MNKSKLIGEINRLRKEKNAVIMSHFYQTDDIQNIADKVGDSLALAQWTIQTDADIIVLCGVHFMGETAKILSPDKKVLILDVEAGCSLAESCPADKFEEFIKAHPDHTVISYVNTTANVKALTDIVVTSTNAKKIIDQLPLDEKIIFGPDKNLGNYINKITGRNMLLWDGACHVHENFSIKKLIQLKEEHPDAVTIAHPECPQSLLILADFIGSTQDLLNYTTNSEYKKFLVATESGILHQMKKNNPDKMFIPVPPNDSTSACNQCSYMRLNTLEKLYLCLKNESPEILIDETLRLKALKPIIKMLEMS
jgi:quinolinate synthase